AGTIVGEGLTFADVVVEPHGLVHPTSGEVREVLDRLVVAERDHGSKTSILTRALALVLLVVLLPTLALPRPLPIRLDSSPKRYATVLRDRRYIVLTEPATGLVPCLLEVVQGRRALVGVSAWTGPWPDDVSPAIYEGALSAPQGVFAVDAVLA